MQIFSASQLIITENEYIGGGTNRACYVHPTNPQLCIKVTISGNQKESNREIKYFNQLKKQSIEWSMLAQFYGIISTNYGDAMVCDLIRDYDNSISKTLLFYVQNQDSYKIENLFELLDGLEHYLIQNLILVKDLNFLNILYQRTDPQNGKLVIIDGIGDNHTISIYLLNKVLTKKRCQQQWKNFKSTWPRKIRNNPYYIDLLKTYNDAIENKSF